MTIAVSVVVKPSKLLALLLAGLCACVVAVGMVLGLGLVGELPIWLRIVCATFCVVAAGGGFIGMQWRRQKYHLDISGTGQIRLRALVHAPKHGQTSDIVPHGSGMLVTLLADSTLWPSLLMLRLQDDEGHVHALPILPDSLPAESFRALGVACRWIAAHRFSELN